MPAETQKCLIRWVMPIATAKACGLPTRQQSPRDLPLAETWTYTDHSLDAEATHEVRLCEDPGAGPIQREVYMESARRIVGRDTGGWIPCCEAHADYSRRYLANWEERSIYGTREWALDWEHAWRGIAHSIISQSEVA